jgi:hypothetical protein
MGVRQGKRKGWRSGITLLFCLLTSLSCRRGSGDEKPVASLSDSTAASRAFEHARAAWARGDASERADLRRELASFIQAFPSDGLAPVARLYLVLSLMDSPADYAQAERRLGEMSAPPPGTTHDLYIVAEAKLLRFHHEPQAAFDLIGPIVGKVVDGRARALLQEELTFDALEARQPYEAIAYMDAWLRGASEDEREASEAKVAVALGAVPEPALRQSLAAMRAASQGGPSRGYGVTIQRLVAEKLGQIAVDHGDASLARWLLDPQMGTPLLAGETSTRLEQLATSRRGIGAVAGRTVGLVMPTSSADLRDEAAEVLRGVLWALDIAKGGPRHDDAVRLVTHDDAGDPARLRAGLEEAAGEGATVIIVALDSASAADATLWGETAGMSIITLALPAESGSGNAPAGFSVGEDWDDELSTLLRASSPATPQKSKVATVADSEAIPSLVHTMKARDLAWPPLVSCDAQARGAGESRFPLRDWAEAGVDHWLVAGSAACAEDLLNALRQRQRPGVMELSLEASDMAGRPPPGLRIVAVGAGIVPVTAESPPDARVADARAMAKETGNGASWWASLGHDAAVLARTALGAIGTDTTTDKDEIARRRAAVREALASAKGPLWTSERTGFDTARRLARTLRTIEVGR